MNKKTKKQHLLNKEIRANEVRLDGQVMRFSEALNLAESQEMDLVLMAANANPPVVKIMNYEKFIYEQNKREKQKPKNLDIKEIKIGPNTSDNDLDYRVKHMIEFLKKGHKVKLTMQFKGRELSYVDNGKALMLKMALSVEEDGVAENLPVLEGKRMHMTIKPKPKK